MTFHMPELHSDAHLVNQLLVILYNVQLFLSDATTETLERINSALAIRLQQHLILLCYQTEPASFVQTVNERHHFSSYVIDHRFTHRTCSTLLTAIACNPIPVTCCMGIRAKRSVSNNGNTHVNRPARLFV